MVVSERFDTLDVRHAERFAYWQEAVCDTYVRLGCDAKEKAEFEGFIDIERHSHLSISRVGGKAHVVDRRPRDIRHATEPFFLLSLQTKECSRITQHNKSSLLKPGDMALYSSISPYRLELFDDFSQLVIQLPAEKMLARLPNAEMKTAERVDGSVGIGRLVRDNILAFSKHAANSNETVRALVQDTLIDLIATGLAAQSETHAELSSPEQHILLRAKSFIRGNLGNPELDRHMVAAEIGMSVRRLNAIFAKENISLSAYIRKTRLDSIASELLDPRFDSLSISEIAIKFGIENFQHFSTLFRATFDSSPRDYRMNR